MLATRFDQVLRLTRDGLKFASAGTLFDVPVAKISESDPYWEMSWHSLDDFLAERAQEEEAKVAALKMRDIDPNNPSYKAQYKRHEDNCSKHRKIDEIFGPHSSYHPNQLISKRHMPVGGLCKMEIMYHAACKISELKTLQKHGELGMDPFDFFRWRIDRLVTMRTVRGESAKGFIRSVIQSLGGLESEKDPKAGDALFREAVKRAAKYEGRDGAYGSKKTRRRANGVIHRSQSRPKATPAPSLGLQERREAQKKRRTERPQTAGIYQGVNAFRQKKKGE